MTAVLYCDVFLSIFYRGMTRSEAVDGLRLQLQGLGGEA